MHNNISLFIATLTLSSSIVYAAPKKTVTPQTKTAKPKPSQAKPTQTPTEDVTVLEQVQSGPVTIRLRRARWAESDEVTAWRNRGKQLTLWFDALLDPKIKLPEGATPNDYLVNVQVVDKNERAIQVFPIDPLRLWHRSSLPYVPSQTDFEPEGQSVWRVRPFDPNFNVVKLRVEWLKPGHPFERKTLPPSLLVFGKEAKSSIAPNEWLQVLEMELPQEKIEYGTIKKDAVITAAHGANERFKVALTNWRKSSWRVTSGEREGQTGESLSATFLLETNDPNKAALLKDAQVFLQNDAGLNVAMIRMMGEASEWFAPNGKPLKANQRSLSGSFELPKEFDPNSPLRLKVIARNNIGVRYNNAGQQITTLEDQERDGNASVIELKIAMPENAKANAQ